MPPSELADVAVMITVLAAIELVFRVIGPSENPERAPQPPGSGTPASSTDGSGTVLASG